MQSDQAIRTRQARRRSHPIVGRFVVMAHPYPIPSGLVVIDRIRFQNSLQMPFAEDQDMIQAVATECLYQALNIWILLGLRLGGRVRNYSAPTREGERNDLETRKDHEEIKVYGGADRLHPAAGRGRHSSR